MEGERFVDFLKRTEELSCELIIGDVDGEATFEWDEDSVITQAGYEMFRPIMDGTYEVLDSGNIIISCAGEEEYNKAGKERFEPLWNNEYRKHYGVKGCYYENLGYVFLVGLAGYVDGNSWDAWFKGEWCN